ncbi:MAG: hypothetical protein A2113_00015 [Candidatus Woykebacteria bacterium GWA1_44_8]|uniref:Terminase large subunit gp17-like C-terminal domain-containing protein n=1 Tax=Candidatus Woykebacteria bacterium GWA1_44_8 TaxID=1802591 RepID=A0A1G1W4X9_9BACT|nr:MAG: hypothetical protein A2113_00015 [Candidatus Woykebacteria bacterium GWA1_44_8]
MFGELRLASKDRLKMKNEELYRIFKLHDKPIELSPMQKVIFYEIIDFSHIRTQIIAPTQYGKTLTVALAILTAAVGMSERFTVLAPSEKKARILMNYCIEHLFDSEVFLSALDLDPNITWDKLRRERTRTNLSFKGGGGIQVLSLDARNTRRNIEAVMGFGGNRLILDESSLIDDPLYATVKRMLGGYKYSDTFLLEIGNPFYRNHFYRTWNSDLYHKIFIDYHIGLQEGRYSPEFIDEVRDEAYFDIFYECKFPEPDQLDARGYRFLVTDTEYQKSLIETPVPDGELKLGADIGAGGDFNVFTVRSQKCAWVEEKNQTQDTMTNVNVIRDIMKKRKITARNVFVDDIGIGRGVTDRLKELGIKVNGISSGAKPKDTTRYKNIKAEMTWNFRKWIKEGGKLVKNEGYNQVLWIKYKVSTDKVIQIEPKDELMQRTGKSPDYFDSLALTFAPQKPEPKIRFI